MASLDHEVRQQHLGVMLSRERQEASDWLLSVSGFQSGGCGTFGVYVSLHILDDFRLVRVKVMVSAGVEVRG